MKRVDIGKPGFAVGIFKRVFEFVTKKVKKESRFRYKFRFGGIGRNVAESRIGKIEKVVQRFIKFSRLTVKVKTKFKEFTASGIIFDTRGVVFGVNVGKSGFTDIEYAFKDTIGKLIGSL